jgi:zinc protease
VPETYELAGGLRVWLLERHTLPLVAVHLVVPAGGASDPSDKAGLAMVTADMLDEGAGKRGPLELARDVDALGASLSTGAYADYAYVHLTSPTKNLPAAAAIMGDVVARPRFLPAEWKRVHALWTNALRARQSDPNAVADVVTLVRAYPPGHPYARPTSGTTSSAARVSLDDVRRFYASHWRPDRATVVVVGDVTRAQLDPLLGAWLVAWKPRRGAAPALPEVTSPGPPRTGRRVVVVDRPDAPQSVIALVRSGVAAADAEGAPLVRVNAAIGGSFTSRLNQNLREEHGWSYGARSRFSFTRMTGIFSAQAAVHTDHTGDALGAMLAEVSDVARAGLTPEEVDKTRLLARGDLVDAFETNDGAARRLGRSAGVGLAADHEARSSARVYEADAAALAKLAGQHVDPRSADVVIVGPRNAIEPQLEAIGITAIEAAGPEGETR